MSIARELVVRGSPTPRARGANSRSACRAAAAQLMTCNQMKDCTMGTPAAPSRANASMFSRCHRPSGDMCAALRSGARSCPHAWSMGSVTFGLHMVQSTNRSMVPITLSTKAREFPVTACSSPLLRLLLFPFEQMSIHFSFSLSSDCRPRDECTQVTFSTSRPTRLMPPPWNPRR